jgi:predicted transcriptional regulator
MADIQPSRRRDLYVVARLLERLWRENAPMVKTRLQVAANLNYSVFARYLRWMLDKELVEMVRFPEGHEKVALTAKGGEAYRKLAQWIAEVVSSDSWDRPKAPSEN